MATTTSLWATAALKQLSDSRDEPLHRYPGDDFDFEVKLIGNSLWIIAGLAGSNYLAFRTAYAPEGFDDVQITTGKSGTVTVNMSSAIGRHQVDINLAQTEQTILHYTTSLSPLTDLFIPFWPRDIIAYGKAASFGEIHISQTGTRSGLLYGSFKASDSGSFLYFQNLSALSAYNSDTETSAGSIVGGQWPEMGISLPTEHVISRVCALCRSSDDLLFYYPPMLPEDMLAKEIKTGELDPKLWIALEDIHDGWEQSGSVGQEVYGAGLTFGVVPRQYIRITGQDFLIFIDYPVLNQKISGNTLSFDLTGDARPTCRLRINEHGKKRLPKINIAANNPADQQLIDTTKPKADGTEYLLHGNQKIMISWK